MSKIYIFSESPADEIVQFFRVVIADSEDEAKRMILDPETDSLHDHLVTQMEAGGVYSHVATIEEALKKYFPHLTVLPMEKGLLMRAGNGYTRITRQLTTSAIRSDKKSSEIGMGGSPDFAF